MPRRETILTVFVASPGDVREEREVVEAVVRELNITFRNHLGVRVELIRWETDAVPGMGSDPQAVINDAIGEDYDVFLGILWTRFGTSTPRARSGTEEEFERAYGRWRADEASVRIMLYFKETAIDPNAVDLQQLSAVRDFRSRVGQQGLYSTFKDKDEFATMLRIHLFKVVQKWTSNLPVPSTPSDRTPAAVAGGGEPASTPSNAPGAASLVDAAEEDVGFIDLVEEAIEHLGRAMEVLLRMASTTGDLDTRIRQRTADMEGLSVLGDADRSAVQGVAARAAEDYTFFARTIAADTPLFAESYRRAFDALARSATLFLDFAEGKETLEDLLGLVRQLRRTVVELVALTQLLRDKTAGMPRLTTALNRSRRQAVEALDRMIAELQTAENLAGEAEGMIVDALGDSD